MFGDRKTHFFLHKKKPIAGCCGPSSWSSVGLSCRASRPSTKLPRIVPLDEGMKGWLFCDGKKGTEMGGIYIIIIL